MPQYATVILLDMLDLEELCIKRKSTRISSMQEHLFNLPLRKRHFRELPLFQGKPHLPHMGVVLPQ